MTTQQIADKIPHEFRKNILLDWLPAARPSMASEQFRMLWEAYFIYVDPDAIKKADCLRCFNNVLENWKHLAKHIAAAEQEYNLLEQL